MPRAPDRATLAELKAVVGPGGWLEGAAEVAPYVVDFRGLYHGATPLVLCPSEVDQVAGILALCRRDRIAVVPCGGNTSYCGGATPDESNTQIVLALRRLNRVRSVDPANASMIVEAGVTLAEAQAAACAAERLFPLSLGSEGTAQIGGNLSTNAGGTAVLRYGMMRDLVLGLEVVLPDGRVMSELKGLRKDNTGYDLKSLFIGAEGTLGVITAACLKLFPQPAESATAIAGVDSPKAALALLGVLRTMTGDALTTFELMPRNAVELTVRHVPGVANPLDVGTPWFVLIEVATYHPQLPAGTLLGSSLEEAAAADALRDAVLASSIAQSQAMWKLRESIPEAQRRHGGSLKHDISVPVAALPAFIEQGAALVAQQVPEGELIAYGHLGDGNLHFNVSQRPGSDAQSFRDRGPALEAAIYDLVQRFGGSFSAEHGIGRLKVGELERRTDPVELDLMRTVKRALDPDGLMNPGKVLRAG